MARGKSDARTKEQEQDAWDRAYQEIERSRQEKSDPDLTRFADLMKPVGGKK